MRRNLRQGELVSAWSRDQMETFSALLALCEGNPLVTGGFPSQRPVTWNFDIFFDLCLNKRLSKQSWGWWFWDAITLIMTSLQWVWNVAKVFLMPDITSAMTRTSCYILRTDFSENVMEMRKIFHSRTCIWKCQRRLFCVPQSLKFGTDSGGFALKLHIPALKHLPVSCFTNTIGLSFE